MKTVSNVYLLGFLVTLCIIIIDSTAHSTFRTRPRSTRGFKNAALSTARGFGKRDGFLQVPETPMELPFDTKKAVKEDGKNPPASERKMMKILILLLAIGYSIQTPAVEDIPENEVRTEAPTEEPEEPEVPESYPDGECPEFDGEFPVYLADLKNCSVFYQCANGYPYRMTCTFPLEFNLNLRVCDFPGVSGCIADKRVPYRMIGRCPPNLSPGVTKLLRDTEDNTIYYECVGGTPVLRKCPEGTIFTFRRTCEPATA